ncbi:MAG TPA: thioredoxin reductase [Candidatus Bathyarchaeota archaeon]|nr:thioredoxin reductase [Candidatus Bathyarchaeota archaeon]
MFGFEKHQLIVIGGGPAGLTAGMYAASLKIDTLIIEGTAKPRLALAEIINNYPGFTEPISGVELLGKMREHALKMGAKIVKSDVISTQLSSNPKMLTTRENKIYSADAVIIATGLQQQSLRIKNEQKLTGRGVSYCAVCDGPLFAGKTVALVGSGEALLEEAERLSGIVGKLYVIQVPPETVESERIMSISGKIELVEKAIPVEILGDEYVTGLKISVNGTEELLEVGGVFIATEKIPTAKLLENSGVKTDARGCIIVDKDQRTSVEGVYAAGDCTCRGLQVVTAAGDAAVAAINASVYIRRKVRGV